MCCLQWVGPKEGDRSYFPAKTCFLVMCPPKIHLVTAANSFFGMEHLIDNNTVGKWGLWLQSSEHCVRGQTALAVAGSTCRRQLTGTDATPRCGLRAMSSDTAHEQFQGFPDRSSQGSLAGRQGPSSAHFSSMWRPTGLRGCTELRVQ